jgi:replicative DNA helicase
LEDLLRSSRARKDLGKPLPNQFQKLVEATAIYRRGQFVLIASGPNRGKSLLALNIAVRSGLRTLYISPDMSSSDTVRRISALLTGDTLEEVGQAFELGEEGHYEEVISYNLNNKMRFVWDTSLTLNEFNEEIEAFGIAYGDYPELVIVDNIRDLYAAEDKFQSWNVIEQHLKAVALSTGALVIGLHHLLGMYADGTESPPLNGVEGQITKKPDQVWTLWGSSLGKSLKVNIVKNRGGKASPAGNLTVELQVDYDRAEIIG